MSSAGRWPVVCVLGRQAQRWARVTKNKIIRTVRPKANNIREVGPGYYSAKSSFFRNYIRNCILSGGERWWCTTIKNWIRHRRSRWRICVVLALAEHCQVALERANWPYKDCILGPVCLLENNFLLESEFWESELFSYVWWCNGK